MHEHLMLIDKHHLYHYLPVFMDESIEGKAISPACREVSNVDIRIAGGLHLTPQQESVLR